jgi:O-methyltransferase
VERQRRIVAKHVARSPALEQWLAAKPRFFAFDSFAGLPDGEADRHADYGAGAYACSQSQFHANIAAKGVDMARVVTVPGMYDQSLVPAVKERHQLRRAALIMIDCDLYESTMPVLDFITDLVGQGTISSSTTGSASKAIPVGASSEPVPSGSRAIRSSS